MLRYAILAVVCASIGLLAGVLLAANPVLAMNLVETYEKALSYDSGIAAACSASCKNRNADAHVRPLPPGGASSST